MTGSKSKQKVKKENSSQVYCRKCMQTKTAPRNFFSAVDYVLDKNGHFSVCKSCCEEIYAEMYRKTQNFSSAIYDTCKILNVAYDERAVASANTKINESIKLGRNVTAIFGMYKQALAGVKNITDQTLILTFSEPKAIDKDSDSQGLREEDISRDWFLRWGSGRELDEYLWLEEKLSQWKKTHKCDTEAEETLLTELVWLQFAIKRERETNPNPDTGALVKDLQNLMKTAAVDPGKAAAANSGKGHDAFGDFIKTIEETEPAEFYKDKELFSDVDNLDAYFLDYVVRPLKNFITGSRDFTVSYSENGEIESIETDDRDFEKSDSPEV